MLKSKNAAAMYGHRIFLYELRELRHLKNASPLMSRTRANALVYDAVPKDPQDPLRWAADLGCQLPWRQGRIAICQENPKYGVRQRHLFNNIVRLLTAMRPECMPQTVHRLHFCRLGIDPVHSLRPNMCQVQISTLFAQVLVQVYAQIAVHLSPPIKINTKLGINGRSLPTSHSTLPLSPYKNADLEPYRLSGRH
jgi:hypothetical protein